MGEFWEWVSFWGGCAMGNVVRPTAALSMGARMVLFGLGVGLVALVVDTLVSYRSLRELADNNVRVSRSQSVLMELEEVLSTLKDAETGQRGYLLTGRVEYLAPYDAAVNEINSRMGKLQNSLADNPAQKQRLAQLDSKLVAKLAELAATVQLAKNHNAAAAVNMVKSNRGKQDMDAIRQIMGQMMQEEQNVLAQRREKSAVNVRQAFVTFSLASAGVLVLLCATGVGLWRHLRFRAESDYRIRAERAWLEVTLGSIGDAVLATDNAGRIVFLNPMAESLTGWQEAAARGKHVDDVFCIFNEQTRQTAENPVARVLRDGLVVGLGNHTVLRDRGGNERPIDDSAAPIVDDSKRVVGVVMVFRDATVQRQTEHALRRLAAIVEFSEDAMITKTPEGIITSWNPAAERILGYTAAEAVGQHINIIIPEDRRAEHQRLMERLKAGERVQDFDTIRRRKDGGLFAASLLISPLKDKDGNVIGASKVLRDITERKQAEEALAFLARASRMLAALVDRTSALQRAAGITVPFFADWCTVHCIDSDGEIELQACAHRDPQRHRVLFEVLDKHPLDWSAPSLTVRVLRTGVAELVEEMSETVAASLVPGDKERRLWFGLDPRSVICVPLLIRDRVVGAMTFVACGTSRRYKPSDVNFAEDLGARVATAIDNAHLFNSVKQVDRQKDEFLAMLAHELRNPLAAIQYATDLARMPTTEPKEELFVMIDRQVKNLAHLIDDLLDVSRISRDKIKLKRESVDAATIVARAAAASRPLIDARRHRLSIDIAREAMPLHADPTRTEQIVANLLTNAAKYTPNGGEINLRAYPEDGFAVIKVKDTGIGLPPELLPRVFDLFTQADRTLDRAEGGLGIGLTVVRKLAELHGGSASAASEGLGHGSEFTVRLPLSDHQLQAGAAVEKRAGKPDRSLRILVVDDNPDTANASALLVKAAGHNPRVAYDGLAALALAREYRPHAVLLDIGLPGMNGYEIAQTLRREGFDKMLLIAVSGYGQAEDRRRSREAGFNHHVIKPMDHEVLRSLLAGVAAEGS